MLRNRVAQISAGTFLVRYSDAGSTERTGRLRDSRSAIRSPKEHPRQVDNSAPYDVARTVCTLSPTLRRLPIAPKMAARLSMLGLPLGESMRCRLLLGVAVIFANCSKPSVAFTRSRRI